MGLLVLWGVAGLRQVDGTREFVDRNGQFVVMIGLAIDGAAAAGVVFQPTEGRLWWGANGVAVEIRPDGATVPVRVSDQADPARATTMMAVSTGPISRIRLRATAAPSSPSEPNLTRV